MRRNCLIGFILAAGLGWAATHQAAAQGASDADLARLANLQSDLRDAVTEEADIIAAITQGVAEAKKLLEEHKSRVAQADALKPEGEALRTAIITQNTEAEKQHAAVVAHNASCPHETKDSALIAKCNGEMGQLNAWASRLKTEMERLGPSKEKYNNAVAELQKRDQEVVAQIAELRANDSRQREKLTAVRARMSELRAALAKGKARCGEIEKAAKDAGNAEALRYCRAMVWSDPAETSTKPMLPDDADN